MNVPTIALAAIAGLVALAAAGFQGFRLGGDSVRAEYAARDLKAAAEAAALTKATEESYRQKEQASAQKIAQVSADYQGKLTDAQRKTTIALDAIRSGSLRLRLTDPIGAPDCRAPSETAASPARPDGAREGRFLGDADSAFLVAQASRCDAIVLRLNGTQDALEADRR